MRFGLGARGQRWGDASCLSLGMLHPLFPRETQAAGIIPAAGSPSFRRGLNAAMLSFSRVRISPATWGAHSGAPRFPLPELNQPLLIFSLANSPTAQSQGLIQRAGEMGPGRTQPCWEPAWMESELFPSRKKRNIVQHCPPLAPAKTLPRLPQTLAMPHGFVPVAFGGI